MSESASFEVSDYHEQTKHRFTGLARSPDTLDWDAQPVAFRRFEGAALTQLALQADTFTLPFSALFTGASAPVQPLTIDNIGLLLEISMAVAAWKEFGSSRWALRCNPSSGNLHPTEAYLIPQGIDGIDDGLYHYRPDEHGLELRCRFQHVEQTHQGLLLGLSSVHWREAWKYGERAYRYCQLDVGHAVAAISYAAATLGWKVTPHYEVSDVQLAQMLGINRSGDYPKGSEQEHPDLLVSLHPADHNQFEPNAALQRLGQGQWFGEANILDRRHFYQWPIIEQTATAAQRPASAGYGNMNPEDYPPPCTPDGDTPAATLFRRRRSAQAFDAETGMRQQDFFRTLDHLLRRDAQAPWASLPWTPRVHPILFVHRVEGIEPGLYALPRRAAAVEMLQTTMLQEFEWMKVDTAPAHLPLYRLMSGKVEGIAVKLSCGQGIAGHSAFSMAMLAEFNGNIRETPWRYRELHWEAGAIGQVLYLEAEASNLQGTGIGCFFDDGVHELLGISGTNLQVIYHFTLGKAQSDERITTLPAYDRT